MQFRCPNCQQAILLGEKTVPIDPEGIECPSCHSRFSLSEDQETTESLPTGQMIGHFRVVSVLGEGGFGIVYRAWDEELKRHVALKVPRQGRDYRDNTKLFLREARAAAAVHHPNVVSVFEIGVHEDQPYIASQLIDGVSLSDFRRVRSLDFQTIARLMIKVLRGVHAFHEYGLIHRDLKPANILIDHSGEPFVTDFGLAKCLESEGVTVTAAGRVVGTLHYMSPEQAAGNTAMVTPSSDIFACGVILFELMTGKRPYQASSSQTLLYQILNSDPPSPRRSNSNIPLDLQTICLKAMSRDAADRYESASAFADDLQRYLDHRPITARPISPMKRASRFVCRNRAASVAASIASVAIVLAFSAFAFRSKPTVGVPVVISTAPAADQIEFTRYDSSLRVPHRSGFKVTGGNGETFDIIPGLYKVVAFNGAGQSHEVWRNVPEASTARSGVARFPHLDFQRRSDGTVELPAFRLFRDEEVAESMVFSKGGEFVMGYEEKFGQIAAKHTQVVDDFLVGVNEVSWARFRKIMSAPYHRQPTKNYLQLIDQFFGDRSDEDENDPVEGYPPDVAILYAELAGGRLPTNAEYEYLATQGGRADFPGGSEPAIAADEPWEILAIDSPTPDTTQEGVRNLFASVAEVTDSSTIAYIQQYPDQFVDVAPELYTTASSLPDELKAQLARQREIRGAPISWVIGGLEDTTRNVRKRISLPPITIMDSEAATYYARIGWRIYRTHRE